MIFGVLILGLVNCRSLRGALVFAFESSSSLLVVVADLLLSCLLIVSERQAGIVQVRHAYKRQVRPINEAVEDETALYHGWEKYRSYALLQQATAAQTNYNNGCSELQNFATSSEIGKSRQDPTATRLFGETSKKV